MRRTDTSLAALLLTQRLVDNGAAPFKAREYWDLLDVVPDPGSLLGLDAAGIASTTQLDAALAERIARRLDLATALAVALDEHEQSGVRAVTSVDDAYPAVLRERLGRGAPPLLHIAGDATLLSLDLFGIVGSRNVTPTGSDVAKRAASEAVRHGHGVVSGGAKGVDRLAMSAALAEGGVVVGVLADSLVRATRDPDVRRAIGDGKVCFCSPYKPTAAFSVANAMGRNKVIYALSAAALVVASDAGTGGTWAGAAEALKRRIAPVLVWIGDGAGSGNEQLVGLGATPVDDLGQLFPLSVARGAASRPGQLTLEV